MKNAVLYRYQKLLKILGICCVLFLTICIAITISGWKEHGLPNGTQYLSYGASIISFSSFAVALLFGMLSYDSDLKFFLQNSVTRQQAHLSFICVLPICLLISFAQLVFELILSSVFAAEKYKIGFNYICILFDLHYSFIKCWFVLALAYIALMSLAYLLKCVIKSFKLPTLGALGFVIIAAISMDIAMANSGIKLIPAFYYIPKLFFIGSVYGECFISYFIASTIILSVIFLSIAHIITLKKPLKAKEG